MRTVLSRSLERAWNVNREMRGWGLGDSLDLLPDNGDSDNDLDCDE